MNFPADLKSLEIPEALSLIVGWKKADEFAGGEVRVATKVADHLRSACEATIKRISAREERIYTPDMQLEDEEVLVAPEPDVVADSPIAAIVLPTAPLPIINAQSLPKHSLWFYSVGIMVDGVQIAFVRKANPRTSAKAGSMFALLGQTLTRIGGPVFGLDDYFDLVVTEHGIIGLSQQYFELLFRDTPALQQRIPEWVQAISDHIPLAGNGAARLAERAATDGRLRRRLRSIAERGHLANVTIERIREHIAEAHLEESRFLDGDELLYDDANPFDLVYMLNEDFFQGGLTDAGFRSDRKSPR